MKNWKKFQSIIKEADVRYAYKCEFESFLKGIDFTTPFNTDGFGRYEDLKILSEYKKDAKLLRSRRDRMNVLAQAVMYLKDFVDKSPENIPNIIFCGDVHACFLTDTDSLIPHLKDDIDWNRAPSSPDTELIKNLVNDENISLWTKDISDLRGFDFKREVIDLLFKIKDKETKNKIEITENNIVSVFEDWERNVLNDKKMEPHSRVKNFVDSMIDEHSHQSPKHRSRFYATSGWFKVNAGECTNFFNKYKQGYSPSTIEKFHSIQDRLVEDSKRRFQGEFFTPKVWVDEAQRMITEELGQNWRDECLVIDCACGTANLTRDYHFKDLILTTINQEDIDVINGFGYNKGAVVKRWDFLNEEIPKEIESKLIDAGKTGKKVVWFINPPFGTATMYNKQTNSKAGISKNTLVSKLMKQNGINRADQLYIQFVFRILQIDEQYKLNSSFGFYSVGKFLTGSQDGKFRELFLNKKQFISGFLSSAEDFGASKSWGVLFSLWKNGKNGKNRIIINAINKDFISSKELYWANGNSASEWVKMKSWRKKKIIDSPKQKSGLNFLEKDRTGTGNLREDSLSYFFNTNNNVMHNGDGTAFYSSSNSLGHGLPVWPENFMRSIALYTARKLIKNNWINNKDEYIIPNTKHKDYKAWNNDAVVYALFNTSNNCTAVRDVYYKKEDWDIKNNFFWYTKQEMMELADNNKFQEMYSDAKNDDTGEAYLATIIKKLKFSDEAIKVLELADKLLFDSMKYRKNFHYNNNEKNLQAWDAGYYQLKYLWREKHKDLHDEFRKAYKELEKKMRPMVYELGFLKE